jgi:hypothetical protein
MQSYTSKIRCQAENTLTIRLILWAFGAFAVDKSVEKLWIEMWKNGQGFWALYLDNFARSQFACGTCGKEKFF